MRNVAIVTGASSGVGREFVRRLGAGAGGPLDEIWLVARSEGRLAEVASTCPVPCRIVALDLCDPASFGALRDELAAWGDVRVQWLVNSAGFGRTGSFADVSREDNADMVRLNCLAVVEACHAVLPHMGPGSRIVNLASVAGFMPLPRFSVYSATKSFVIDFSCALDADLAGTGIRVTAVCPRWMRTGFEANLGDEGAFRSMTFVGFDEVGDVVDRAIRAALLGRRICCPSPATRALRVATRLAPVGLGLAALAVLGRLSARR